MSSQLFRWLRNHSVRIEGKWVTVTYDEFLEIWENHVMEEYIHAWDSRLFSSMFAEGAQCIA